MRVIEKPAHVMKSVRRRVSSTPRLQLFVEVQGARTEIVLIVGDQLAAED
jgi:hypothetical protein